ncbi:MAG: hypothetical protein JHC26_09935 [Thermofilum sp.]|jgi:hypothetical protein|uniref:hypothetical protein n=1 Tax=Thermofilum sp. TaxID=1961369 RepID=UPI002586908A|nr:hypothetical protein [Thermofilum sp.]MCI4409402.1 hypothetical protein [Thermofilum sp.]
MTETNISVTTPKEAQKERGGDDEKIVKLLVVRRKNKLTGELYIDRFYLTIPFDTGKELLEKGHVLFKLEIQGDGKIILTPLVPMQSQEKPM